MQFQSGDWSAEQGAKSDKRLKLLDWKKIWFIPCAGAGIVMLIFLLLFKDDTRTTTVTEGEVAEAYAENVPEPPQERQGGKS
jgi:hypothetical protein